MAADKQPMQIVQADNVCLLVISFIAKVVDRRIEVLKSYTSLLVSKTTSRNKSSVRSKTTAKY